MTGVIKTAVTLSLTSTFTVLVALSSVRLFPPSSQLPPPAPVPISLPPTPSDTLSPVSPSPQQRCLVRVRGQIFDVTVFRRLHSGGDIFQCGTDMTSVFDAQHNDQTFSQLQKYKIQP